MITIIINHENRFYPQQRPLSPLIEFSGLKQTKFHTNPEDQHYNIILLMNIQISMQKENIILTIFYAYLALSWKSSRAENYKFYTKV